MPTKKLKVLEKKAVLAAKRKKTHPVALYFFIVVVLGLVALNVFTPVGKFFDPDNIQQVTQSKGIFAPAVYLLIHIVGSIIFIPISIFPIIAGAMFGTLQGTIYSVIGDIIVAVFAFYAARTIPAVDQRLKNKRVRKLQKKIDFTLTKMVFKHFLFLDLLVFLTWL